jgi:hypothetical protein
MVIPIIAATALTVVMLRPDLFKVSVETAGSDPPGFLDTRRAFLPT